MPRLAALAVVLLLVGCGGGTIEHSAAPVVPDRPSPPLTAADEAPPDELLWFLRDDSQQVTRSVEMCASADGNSTCPPPTADERAALAREHARRLDEIRPAADAQPRVVAKLALSGGGNVLFTVWHNGNGKLCFAAERVTPGGGGGSGPAGPCTQDTSGGMLRCDALCLSSSAGSTGDAPARYELTGTVAADASAIRIATADGGVSTYALDGPVVDGDRRVFMVDLGRSDWRTLELVRDGDIVATEKASETTVAFEECETEVGPMPMPGGAPSDLHAAFDAYSSKLDACLRSRPGWQPPLGGLTTGVDTTTSP